MRIEVIEKPKKVEETPFVVGGVYRQYDEYLLLTQRPSSSDFMIVWLGDGKWDRSSGGTQSRLEIEGLLRGGDVVYVPDAYLVVPKPDED